jgi:hypothetical protein
MAGMLPREPALLPAEATPWPMKFRREPPPRSRRFLGTSGKIPGSVPREGLGGGLKDASRVWSAANLNKAYKAKTQAYLERNDALRFTKHKMQLQWRAIRKAPEISERLSEFTRDVPVPRMHTREKKERAPLYPGAPTRDPRAQSPATTFATPETTMELPTPGLPSVGE